MRAYKLNREHLQAQPIRPQAPDRPSAVVSSAHVPRMRPHVTSSAPGHKHQTQTQCSGVVRPRPTHAPTLRLHVLSARAGAAAHLRTRRGRRHTHPPTSAQESQLPPLPPTSGRTCGQGAVAASAHGASPAADTLVGSPSRPAPPAEPHRPAQFTRMFRESLTSL